MLGRVLNKSTSCTYWDTAFYAVSMQMQSKAHLSMGTAQSGLNNFPTKCDFG